MTTKKKILDSEIATRFNIGDEEFNPFSLEGLPAEAWKGFCVVAWMRLERSNPRWAEIILDEFGEFEWTWCSKAFSKKYGGGDVGEKWMREAFQHMLRTKPKKGQKSLDRPRHLLQYYTQFLRDISRLREDNPGLRSKPGHVRKTFWKEKLQGLLNRHPYHDETRTHARVTAEMIETACSAPPSEIALDMLKHLYGISPSRLKKIIFPKLRTSPLSPLELWREKIFKSNRK